MALHSDNRFYTIRFFRIMNYSNLKIIHKEILWWSFSTFANIPARLFLFLVVFLLTQKVYRYISRSQNGLFTLMILNQISSGILFLRQFRAESDVDVPGMESILYRRNCLIDPGTKG